MQIGDDLLLSALEKAWADPGVMLSAKSDKTILRDGDNLLDSRPAADHYPLQKDMSQPVDPIES